MPCVPPELVGARCSSLRNDFSNLINLFASCAVDLRRRFGAYEKNSHLVVHDAGYCFWNGEGHEMLKQKSSAQLEVFVVGPLEQLVLDGFPAHGVDLLGGRNRERRCVTGRKTPSRLGAAEVPVRIAPILGLAEAASQITALAALVVARPLNPHDRLGADPCISMRVGGNHQCASSNRPDKRKCLTDALNWTRKKTVSQGALCANGPCCFKRCGNSRNGDWHLNSVCNAPNRAR